MSRSVTAARAIDRQTGEFKEVYTNENEANREQIENHHVERTCDIAMSIQADANARAEYAKKYFDAVAENARVNLAIAGIQQVAAFYFADKYRDTAKENSARLDDAWRHQKDQSEKLFNHWWNNSREKELKQLEKACHREQEGYKVDYETAKNRVLADVNSEFSKARQKLLRERKMHCVGANRHAHRQLSIAQAKAAVLALNRAYRHEEQRKDLKEAQYREELYKWISLFRGVVGDGLNASKAAASVAAARSGINRYEQWQQAFGGLSNLGNAYGNMNQADAVGQMSGLYSGNFGTPNQSLQPFGNEFAIYSPSLLYSYR